MPNTTLLPINWDAHVIGSGRIGDRSGPYSTTLYGLLSEAIPKYLAGETVSIPPPYADDDIYQAWLKYGALGLTELESFPGFPET